MLLHKFYIERIYTTVRGLISEEDEKQVQSFVRNISRS